MPNMGMWFYGIEQTKDEQKVIQFYESFPDMSKVTVFV
jgi:hypothetical protein